MSDKFYITSAIAYTNAPPHIGHLLEFLQTDVIARYHRLQGKEVFFLTGTDEHGRKNAQAAEKKGKSPKEFVDEISAKFKALDTASNISNDDFIRTTDRERHWPAVEKLWNKLKEAGDLYKANYKGLYCVGHEAFMKPSDLKDGECPLHKQKPEVVEEENWFFKLSKYKKEIKKRIESDDFKILPNHREKEILNLLEDAEDVSFSRPRKDLEWGIPVPDDDSQTIYVWADALVNYISVIGYTDETENFKKLWPADVHLVGKDIARFHAIIWPAMLMSAGLPLPKSIYIHGFVNVEGEKMSKTIGNVIDPFLLLEKYGVDPIRYFLLREIPSGEDGSFSYSKLEERYKSDLANGLGNLVQRVLTLIDSNLGGELHFQNKFNDPEVLKHIEETWKEYNFFVSKFRLHEALAQAWKMVNFANSYINSHKPWETAKNNPEHFLSVMTNITRLILNITYLVYPFIPESAEKIAKSFGFDVTNNEELKSEMLESKDFIIQKGQILFPNF